jgi:F0F1-type ATP synthase gamma subunit
MQITSAMKMVSAAKLKAQDAITTMPYAEKLTVLQNLSTLEGDAGEYTTQRDKKVLLVVVTSNRG